MQHQIVSVKADETLRTFAESTAAHPHSVFPVTDRDQFIGTVAVWDVNRVPAEKWESSTIREIVNLDAVRVSGSCDVMEALRLLVQEDQKQMLLVSGPDGSPQGIVTKTDILRSFRTPPRQNNRKPGS
jgi:predicted transcriptional regulator